jgi:penicillin-binding protein 2
MSKSVKYDASKINERLRDHSLYIAFAPADKPKIALAIIVENAGFGAAAAAPIARQAMDYYLLGKKPNDPMPVVPKATTKPANTNEATVTSNAKPEAAKPALVKPETAKTSTSPSKGSAQ